MENEIPANQPGLGTIVGRFSERWKVNIKLDIVFTLYLNTTLSSIGGLIWLWEISSNYATISEWLHIF